MFPPVLRYRMHLLDNPRVHCGFVKLREVDGVLLEVFAELLEPLTQFAAGQLHRASIQVRSGRGRSWAGVADNIGIRAGDIDQRDIDTQGLSCDLGHLGLNPLPHLDTTMRDQHRTVDRVSNYVSTALVQSAAGDRKSVV